MFYEIPVFITIFVPFSYGFRAISVSVYVCVSVTIRGMKTAGRHSTSVRYKLSVRFNISMIHLMVDQSVLMLLAMSQIKSFTFDSFNQFL